MTTRMLLAGLTVALLAGAPLGASAQRDREARATDQLIEQLRPADPRGIRLPSEPPATPPPASTAANRRPAEPQGVASIRVRFATGSAALSPEAERNLDALGRALSSGALATYRFRIEGHTDRVGTNATNQDLSERRAAAVRDYLTAKHGIAATRLDTVGRGEDDPEVATADEIPDARNRRVRVVNLGA